MSDCSCCCGQETQHFSDMSQDGNSSLEGLDKVTTMTCICGLIPVCLKGHVQRVTSIQF